MDVDFRETVSRALDELAAEDLQAFLRDVLSLEKLQWTRCPHCQEKVQVPTPDYRGYATAIAAFDGIGKGRQKQASEENVDDERLEAAVMRVIDRMETARLERLLA